MAERPTPEQAELDRSPVTARPTAQQLAKRRRRRFSLWYARNVREEVHQ